MDLYNIKRKQVNKKKNVLIAVLNYTIPTIMKQKLGWGVKLVKMTYGFNYYTFQLTGSSVKSTTYIYCIKITHEYISYLKKCSP